MTCCKNCKYYKNIGETLISAKFIDGVREDSKNYIPMPYGDYQSDWGIKNCAHPICFELKENKYQNSYGNKHYYKERIEGCATLNYNKDCKYFKPKLLYKLFKFNKGEK